MATGGKIKGANAMILCFNVLFAAEKQTKARGKKGSIFIT